MILRKLIVCISIFMLSIPGWAGAVESGKVYRVKNIGKPGVNLTASAAVQGAGGANSNPTDLKQQWYLVADNSNTGFYFRNVSSGAYLTSPLATYTQWPLTFTDAPSAGNMLMAIEDYNGNKVIKAKSHNNSYAYAHCDGSNNIVCWLNSSTPTQWEFEEVPYTSEEISSMLARFSSTGDEIGKASVYQQHLSNLFADKACTTLSFTGDLASNADYNALPSPLKTMVDKVKSGNWSEAAGNWDSEHSKKYRIQLYEPYSEGSAAAGMAGIQAYTNMNNPTGIIANSGDILYVMVDKAPKDGATLYIGAVPDCNMYNSTTSGIQLHEGLNMILCNADVTHYFIYYIVNTVQNKAPVKGRELKNYEPITIHIEGGQLNGFFNYVGDKLYKADTESDYRYTIERAIHPMYDLIGQYVILHFFKEDTPDTTDDTVLQKGVKSCFDSEKNPGATKNYNPVVTLEAWDKMCFTERILMGIQSDEDINNPINEGMYSSIVNVPYETNGYNADPGFYYSDYFNNRMMGITLQAKGLYMNATAWRTAYAPSTMVAILTQFPQAGIWGPAHEYGHMNQTPMRIAGTTEESNNVFSNVANYFLCRTTSRTSYPSDQLKVFNEGKTFLEHGTWGTTRMFWQLWCYYHATKHNTSFYPRLYELLRKYPLKRDLTTYNGKLNPKTDLLHFAKMCCVASGEDLTNFFTAWGFFVPQDNYHIDDYDVYDCILTEADIQEVKDEIKAMNFPKNDAIILIDDRPGSELKEGFGYTKAQSGQYGGLNDFKNDAASASGEFSFAVDGNNVSVSGGNPGVGFLIYDEEGNLIGFSNSNNFTLSSEAASALVDGTATVKAVSADNKTVEAIDPVREGSIDTKKQLLEALINRCDELLALADESESKVGSLFVGSCTTLKQLRDSKQELLESSSDSNAITDAYLELSKAYYALLNDPEARIPVVAGSAYRLINYQYADRTLDAGTDKCIASLVNTSSPSISFSQQWVLEPAGETPNTYYIKNLADGRYIGTTKKQSTSIPLTDTPQAYTLYTVTPGVYTFAPDNDLKFGIHVDASRNVVQWNTTSTPTQWKLVKTSSAEIIDLRKEVNQQIANARQTLENCGTMERSQPQDYVFPEENLYTNAKYTGGGADNFTSWKVLFDNDLNTYFHSNYNNNLDSEDSLDHYIRMKAPENSKFRFFQLSYTTRNIDNTGTNPRSFIIEASADGKNWKEIYHTSGLPLGKAVTYSTGEIIAPENTDYIRMIVTGSGGSAKGHPYFVLSELKVADLGDPIFTPNEDFPYLTKEHMLALYDEIIDATLDASDSSTSLQTLKDRSSALNSALATVQEVMIPKVEVNSVSIDVDPIVLKMGAGNVVVTATVDPENATFPEFEWTLSDESIAAIESVDGKSVVIRPVAMGLTTISVNVVGNPLASASAAIKVLPEIPVETLALVPGEISLPLNAGEFTLGYEIYPDNATMQDITWSSSDPSIAEIDEASGIISMQRPGVCEIYATTIDGTDISAKCVVTVTNAVAEGLILYPETLTLQEGEEYTMGVVYIPAEVDQPMVEWSTSDSSVVSVDPSGRIVAVSTGDAVISVKADVNGHLITASASVTVIPVAIKGVSLSDIVLTIEKGASAKLTASFTPVNATGNLEWSVSNTDVVALTVDDIGKTVTLTALKPGMAVVTADVKGNDLIYATCNITVPETAVEKIEFTDNERLFDASEGGKIMAVRILPEDAPVPRLNWEIDNPAIGSLAPVSPLEAEFTPSGNGEANITVSHADRPEIYATRNVEVSGASGIINLFSDKSTPVDVYEITGVVVKKNVEVKELNSLQPGLYIIRQGKTSKEVLVR